MNSQTKLIENESDDLFNFIWTIIIVLLLWLCVKVKMARKNKRHLSRRTMNVQPDKIIIALEIKDFFVRYTTKKQSGYLPIQTQKEETLVLKMIKKFFSIGNFYRPMFSVQKIRDFILGLKSLPNVELYIYTSLQPTIANNILTKLQLLSYFPETHRKYCDLQNNDDQKHAIQIDQDTRRVIIVTPTHDDHTYEDDKYFLVLRPKNDQINFLKNSLKTLKQFIEESEDLNVLHDHLGELKVNMESDWSGDDL